MIVYGHAKVGRLVQITHCNGQRINPNNKDPIEFVDFSFDVYGTYTTGRATKFARKTFGDKSIVINNVEHDEEYYSMDIDTFINNAERIR